MNPARRTVAALVGTASVATLAFSATAALVAAAQTVPGAVPGVQPGPLTTFAPFIPSPVPTIPSVGGSPAPATGSSPSPAPAASTPASPAPSASP